MPRSASAPEYFHEPISSPNPDHPSADHWLTDPGQLAHWQGQLVDCCHAINLQLSQIRQELNREAKDVAPPVTLRIAGAVSTR
ncbi:MAG: hypothetical protein RIK87_22955 [Fuerstiella sp.]